MQHNLAEAVKGYQSLREQFLAMWPELIDDNAALHDTLQGATNLDEMIILVMRATMEREDSAKAIAERIETLKRRKDRLEAGAQKLRAMALQAMQEAGLKKIAAPDFSLSVGQGKPKVLIIDEDLIPDRLCRITRTPSKTMIADEMAAGRDVPGATRSNAQSFLRVSTS